MLRMWKHGRLCSAPQSESALRCILIGLECHVAQYLYELGFYDAHYYCLRYLREQGIVLTPQHHRDKFSTFISWYTLLFSIYKDLATETRL